MIFFDLTPYAIKVIWLNPLIRYLLATLLMMGVVGIRFSVDQALVVPFLFLPPQVLISALLFGWRVGTYVSIVSCALGVYLLEPAQSMVLVEWREVVALGAFAVFCAVLTWLGAVLRGSVIRLAAAEGEKDLLLRELNHRIGNDLSMIAALLIAQAHTASKTSVRQALKQAADRIAVIGSVHSRLRHGHRGAVVDSQEYLGGLCQELRTTFIGDRPIDLSVDVDPAQMSLNSAVMIGLIVNELVANAVKHAFPGNQPGHIEVRFQCQNRAGELVVCDDGVGLPMEQPAGTGLGQLLVRQLTEGMEGTVTIETMGGTSVHIQLPNVCLSAEEPSAHGPRWCERSSLVSRFPGLEHYLGIHYAARVLGWAACINAVLFRPLGCHSSGRCQSASRMRHSVLG
jgi:two-component system, sensor histidine kinase PdtaS